MTSRKEARGEVLYQELGRFYRVAIFGSARLKEDSPEFTFVTNLAKELVIARDVDIVTGGGPGIMKAANYGAQLAIQEAATKGKHLKAKTHGLTIADIPTEESANEHINLRKDHPEFSTRLQDFIDRTQAAYNAPGGIGTLLEQLMIVQSGQVSHIERDYIIIAHPFWEPVVNAWNNELYHQRVANGRTPLINQTDLEIIKFSDNIPNIVGTIASGYDNWRTKIRDHVRVVR